MWSNGSYSSWNSYYHNESSCIADLGVIEAILIIMLLLIHLIWKYSDIPWSQMPEPTHLPITTNWKAWGPEQENNHTYF